jgi:hypothetical protein
LISDYAEQTLPFHNFNQSAVGITKFDSVIDFIKTCKPNIFTRTGLTPFIPYEWQNRLFDKITNNRAVIIKNIRQSGMDLCVMLDMIHHAITNPGSRLAIFSTKKTTSEDKLKIIGVIYKNLLTSTGVKIKSFTKSKLEFENGSVVYPFAYTQSINNLRGSSFTYAYLCDFSFCPNTFAKQFVDCVLPIIISTKTSKIIIGSCINPTPRSEIHSRFGIEDLGLHTLHKFDDLLQKAHRRESIFEPFEVTFDDMRSIYENQNYSELIDIYGLDVFCTVYLGKRLIDCEISDFSGINCPIIDEYFKQQTL